MLPQEVILKRGWTEFVCKTNKKRGFGYKASEEDESSDNKVLTKMMCNIIQTTNIEVSTISKSAVDEWRTSFNQLKEQVKLEHQQRLVAQEALRIMKGKKKTNFGCNKC